MGDRVPRGWWMRRAGAALVLGMATTVGLAWLCAIVDVKGESHRAQYKSTEYIASLAVREAWGMTDLRWIAIANDGMGRFTADEEMPPYWSRTARLNGPFVSATVFGVPDRRIEVATGWPWRALRAEYRGNAMGVRGPGNAIYSTVSGIELPGRFVRRHGNQRPAALPYEPIWPGLMADVMLFGILWWGLIGAVSALRGWRRRQRGCCVACGYDLCGELEGGCPECGWKRRADAVHSA